jgi:negative regulator of flagellin synthesis FlgM
MKIDNSPKPITLPPAAENRPGQAKANPRSEHAPSSVSLSTLASALQQMQEHLATVPMVDRARVDSIKSAIANGEYTINTDNIAAGLLDSVKEMLHVAK